MKNIFGRAGREPPVAQEPVLTPRQQREREENERFMQQLYAGHARPEPEPYPEPMPAPQAAPAPPVAASAPAASAPAAATAPPAAVELLDIARQLLEGRDDVESRVVRVLIGRALELMPRESRAQ
jgi:hypothetical protein